MVSCIRRARRCLDGFIPGHETNGKDDIPEEEQGEEQVSVGVNEVLDTVRAKAQEGVRWFTRDPMNCRSLTSVWCFRPLAKRQWIIKTFHG